MSQTHERRPSPSPYIDTVWHTKNTSDGVYLATPDGAWDLIVLVQADGSRSAMLAGQATKTAAVPYRADTSSVVISFAAGAYLTCLSAERLVDRVELLSNADTEHFILAGRSFAFPSFDSAETLADELSRAGILAYDDTVQQLLGGNGQAMSTRAGQRHIARVTGMTRKTLEQIWRAQAAVKLLQQGNSPAAVAADTGYSDQSHLTHSLRRIMNATPTDVEDIHKL
jgi:hypothetical protein